MRKSKNLRVGKVSRLCRQIEEPANRNKQELASQVRDTLNGAPNRTAPITNHLNRILLAMGYDTSLVELLGRRYGC
jgi:hypothetical protein